MSNFGVEKNKGESTVSLGSLGNGEVTHELDCGICSQSKISDNHLPFPQFSHEVNIFSEIQNMRLLQVACCSICNHQFCPVYNYFW